MNKVCLIHHKSGWSRPNSPLYLIDRSCVGGVIYGLPSGTFRHVRLIPSLALRCQRLYDAVVVDCQQPNVIGGYSPLKVFDFFLRSRAVIAR